MECRRGLAIRILSVCLSVCLSGRLSVCHTRELRQNGRKICPDFYITRKIIYLSLLRRRMVGTLIPEILVNWPPLERNRRFSTDNRSLAPQPQHLATKFQWTLIQSSMNLRWSSYVAPKSPKVGLKNAKRPIFVKNRTFQWAQDEHRTLSLRPQRVAEKRKV